MSEFHPQQKYTTSDILFYRKNDQIFSSKYKFMRMEKDHVRDKDGFLIVKSFLSPEYWIEGIWYKESELSLTPEGLLK